MNKEELLQKLDKIIEKGGTPAVIIEKPVIVDGGSYDGYGLAKLAIEQGAAIDVIELKHPKHTPPFPRRPGWYTKRLHARKKYRLQYGNRGRWIRRRE